MADIYFNQIVKRLSFSEVSVLGILKDRNADVGFKALSGGELREASELSSANFRKVMNQLVALLLVEANTSEKEHKFYLTEFGLRALEMALEKAEE